MQNFKWDRWKFIKRQATSIRTSKCRRFLWRKRSLQKALAGERSNAENFDSENETKEAHPTGRRKFIQRGQGTRDVTALEGRTQNTGRRKLIQREQGTRNVKALEESSRNTGSRPSIFKNA